MSDTEAPKPDLAPKPIVPLETFVAQVSDGNTQTYPNPIEWELQVEMYEKVVAVISSDDAKAKLAEIRNNPDWDPIKKAHKEGLLYSKLYSQALKEYGFATGVLCKKAIYTISNFDHSEQKEEWLALEKKYKACFPNLAPREEAGNAA